MLFENFGESRNVLVKLILSVRAHTMVGRQETGEQSRVRGPRERHGRKSELESDACRREGVDMGRDAFGTSVDSDVVSSGRVHADEKHARAL